MASLAEQVKQHGHVVVGLLKADTFADTIYKLTNSVDQIPRKDPEGELQVLSQVI